MHYLTKEHMQAMRRILCYLKTTLDKGILFKLGVGLDVIGYNDADYGGSLIDRHSTTCYCVFLGGNLVSWRSKKQGVVARSSVEAEFQALALGLCKLLWLKIILEDLRISGNGLIKLCCDNKSTINIAHNPVQHDQTKHMAIDKHFIKEKLNVGLLCIPHVPSEQ